MAFPSSLLFIYSSYSRQNICLSFPVCRFSGRLLLRKPRPCFSLHPAHCNGSKTSRPTSTPGDISQQRCHINGCLLRAPLRHRLDGRSTDLSAVALAPFLCTQSSGNASAQKSPAQETPANLLSFSELRRSWAGDQTL